MVLVKHHDFLYLLIILFWQWIDFFFGGGELFCFSWQNRTVFFFFKIKKYCILNRSNSVDSPNSCFIIYLMNIHETSLHWWLKVQWRHYQYWPNDTVLFLQEVKHPIWKILLLFVGSAPHGWWWGTITNTFKFRKDIN